MACMSEKRFVVMGIDPGCVTGYGIITIEPGRRFKAIDYGCIRPPAKEEMPKRHRIIFESIAELIEMYHPDALAVETQYIYKNPQTGIKLGMARGVAVLAASLREIPIFEYAPSKAKKAVVGKGGASKAQVQWMVQKLLGLATLPEPQDASDALALAICHGHSCR